MRDTDRPVFDAQFDALFGAFPLASLTDQRRDAYWRGLSEMAVETLVRCVDKAIGENGEKQCPSVSRLWEISREARTKGPGAVNSKEPVELDLFARFGNRCLYTFLRNEGPASDASLRELIAIKNRLVDAVRVSCRGDAEYCDDSGDTGEFREMLMDAFAKLAAPRTFAETEADRERCCVEHGMVFVPQVQDSPTVRLPFAEPIEVLA